jgi:hypothetical protein
MNPYVFIVGCPRSGTTLLQRLVDAHPQIAITPETHWIPVWYRKTLSKGATGNGLLTRRLLGKLLRHPRFIELGLEDDAVRTLFKGAGRRSYSRFVSGVFDLYGAGRGKPIVGDKTPGYAREIPTLHALWPAAKFVHLIRDGREVCLSILNWGRAKNWQPGEGAARFRGWAEDPLTTAALWWEWHVRLAREAGGALAAGLYHEVRYEALVSRAADECRSLCASLAVCPDEGMTRSYEDRAQAGPAADAKHPWMPITRGLRNWRSQMSTEGVGRFEAAAGKLLEELGYPLAAPRHGPELADRATRLRALFAEDVRAQGYAVPAGW